jgi:hypothetical protein
MVTPAFPGQAVETILGYCSSPGYRDLPKLGAGDRVGALLDFANTGNALAVLSLLGNVRFPAPSPGAEGEELSRLGGTEVFARELAQVRSDLTEVADDSVSLAMLQRVARTAGQIVLVPMFERSGDSLSMRTIPLGRNDSIVPVLSYALSLILDNTLEYRAALCRCRLKNCSVFFLAKKPATGRPQRRYCSEEHREEAHRLDGARRTAKSRADRKARAAQRRSRRKSK